jgi:Tfp pilus assembly protein FimT
MRRLRGFTMIEMVIVWGMAMVLTAVALPYWKNYLADVAAAKDREASTYHKTTSCLWYSDMAGVVHYVCKGVKNGQST